MNWDQVEGKWKELKGEIRRKWGKLTDNDFETIGGNKDRLAGRLQQYYGYSKDKADQEITEWWNSLSRPKDPDKYPQ